MLETAWESRWVPDYYGGVAQLGEHLPCKQGVKSSNLSISIRQKIKLFFDTEVPQELLAIRVLLHEYALAEVAQQLLMQITW